MDIHAVPLGTPARPGCCTWSHAFEDVLLRCFGSQFPGEPECCDHWIARVQREHPEDRRSFGPFVVPAPEVTR